MSATDDLTNQPGHDLVCLVGPKFTVRPTFRCDVKWPGVTLAVAPSDRQRSDQPLYVAHSRFHRTGTLLERAGDVIS